jgi:phage baseplate assembly protein W
VTDSLTGFGYPFRFKDGGLRRASGFEKLEQDLIFLLSTRQGERVMQRGYGAGLQHRLQEPNDATMRALFRHDMERALSFYLPVVRLTAPIRLQARDAEATVFIQYSARPSDMVRELRLRVS